MLIAKNEGNRPADRLLAASRRWGRRHRAIRGQVVGYAAAKMGAGGRNPSVFSGLRVSVVCGEWPAELAAIERMGEVRHLALSG